MDNKQKQHIKKIEEVIEILDGYILETSNVAQKYEFIEAIQKLLPVVNTLKQK